jgi:hypothetical protein
LKVEEDTIEERKKSKTEKEQKRTKIREGKERNEGGEEERIKTKIYREERKEIVGRAAEKRKVVITTFF